MKPRLIVCVKERTTGADSCGGRGSLALLEQMTRIIQERGLNIDLEKIQCLGQCKKGPNMRLAPGGEFFRGVGPGDIDGIIQKIEVALAADAS
ncbi:MAG: (2Fe-2S) ferredoxin domain-containing protein [Magnetococcales bacterium]|nr:(2Fe-2S) ferredoxin domain-containing protein [Magnetococcales bacterium]MBF0149733.1 (2Fe-2S) ferredoxin domain-containing protein [Magnetococcales bacterium]MBF0174818.1 (2Fe-2S) ferredoxin domain-containing protein [Magnetococcales bacterium]MBF0347611.1 (2Fe-2S) ferredoxin domain-containing protein [Magnetococcales bacterium]MBF0630706.1 (2Fe-2S) ferredoxin domain-containing protein [Magnetococcales bacterium]